MPASADAIPTLSGLSAVHGRAIEVRLDAALMPSDDKLKLPHFRGVFGAQDDCGCAMASSIVSSNVIGDR